MLCTSQASEIRNANYLDMCDSPLYVTPKAALRSIPVPCGKCPPCKKRRVDSWVFRLQQEEKVSQSAHFVTLTYDTNHVPISDNGFMTLDKTDVQKFFKRLRKAMWVNKDPLHDKVKYYIAGEYGTNTKRPHYHAIIFNCPDAEYYAKAWTAGQIHIGQVTQDSVAYTMKYIDKWTDNRKHARDDRKPEFALMSKGLGENYLSDAVKKYHQSDISKLYLTRDGGHRIAMPKYYRDKLFDDDQKKEQVKIVQEAVEQQEYINKIKYDQNNNNPKYTYDDHKNSQKVGRNQRFFNYQNRSTI